MIDLSFAVVTVVTYFLCVLFDAVTLYEKSHMTIEQLLPYILAAIKSFFKAIALSPEQRFKLCFRFDY
jgi:hypothetical protein